MYRILDLFCGAGGAAVGYQRSGFEVVGVDISPQPHYPFAFIQDDALSFLRRQVEGSVRGYGYDAIHASPPCQDYSATKHIRGGRTDYPRLIGPVRELLEQTGLPWVIENVELARPDMRNPVRLCGSMFGNLGKWHGDTVYLQRHRLIEGSGFELPQPECDHSVGTHAVTVAGHGRPDMGIGRGDYFAGKGYAQLCRDVMDIQWMTRDELCEAIPPSYSRYVGHYLREHLSKSISSGFQMAALSA